MIPSRRDSHTIPISVARCPVHGSIVGRDGVGRLIGKCEVCAEEVADGLIWLRRNPLHTNTTRVGGSDLGVSATDARRESF